jgi:DNA helicase II / ATP-dependent DNA helicase PcrA
MNHLNPAQHEAVITIEWPLLINAWAWSGKTHTITERVVYMIQEQGINPRSIFCVTFTNKAAKEMRERIAKKLGLNPENINPFRESRLPIIGTFHSTASFFLRMFIDRVGYAKDFVIYDSDDCLRTVKDIMKKQGIDEKEFQPRWVQGMISQAKGKGLSPTEFAVTVDSYFGSVVLEVYKEYASRLKADNALDFDDLLLLFRQILDIDEVREYFHNRFQYFMVDEYQDTNWLQYEIIRILASKTKNLCVVGDDWQGIYSWRGADIENILSFKKDYPTAKVINLEENYRSTQTIINAANDIIKNNTNQMKKTLFTSNPVWEKIIILEWVDEKHEAELIANTIREDGAYADWAILYRTNGQSRLIEESLIRKNIPYRVFGGLKFYERREVKDILAYIRIIFNPNDTISLKRIINVPSRKIGDKTLDELFNILGKSHINISDLASGQRQEKIQDNGPIEESIDAIFWISDGIGSFEHLLDSLATAGRKWVMQFLTFYAWLREQSKTVSVSELMELIIKRTNYLEYLKSEYGEDEYEAKVDNVQEFCNMASRYDGLLYPENLALFLEDIALITDQDRENEQSREMVSLMTVHLAKWLEYPKVVIAGAEEGVFPHSRSLMEAAAIEEERRLMYVAITRAKLSLYITRAHERYTFGNYSANPKSRFVKEISDEYLYTETQRWSAQSIFGSGSGSFSSMSTLFSQNMSTPSSGTNTLRPTSSGMKKNDASSFATGERIRHPQYGVWTIVSLSGAVADIAFSGMGVKKMNIEIAPIQKIS